MCSSYRVECCICHKLVKREEIINCKYGGREPFHRACMAKCFQVPLSLCCPDCRHPLEGRSLSESIASQKESPDYEWLSPWWSNCPSCGAPDPLIKHAEKCRTCRMPMMQAFQIVVKELVPLGEDNYGVVSYHEFCRPDLTSHVNPFPNWDDGFLHWMTDGKWHSNAPPPVPHADNSGGCFVATAAYGTSMEPDVQILRDYRDRVLAKNRLGQLITASYLTLSPPLARLIHAETLSGAVARACLRPMVAIVKYRKRTEFQ